MVCALLCREGLSYLVVADLHADNLGDDGSSCIGGDVAHIGNFPREMKMGMTFLRMNAPILALLPQTLNSKLAMTRAPDSAAELRSCTGAEWLPRRMSGSRPTRQSGLTPIAMMIRLSIIHA